MIPDTRPPAFRVPAVARDCHSGCESATRAPFGSLHWHPSPPGSRGTSLWDPQPVNAGDLSQRGVGALRVVLSVRTYYY